MLKAKKLIYALVLVFSTLVLFTDPALARFETNKWDKKKAVKNGGWYVAYGRELTETDVIEGAVAAGVSVYTANTGPIMAWAERLIDESIAEMQRSLGRLGSEFGQEAQRRARNVAVSQIKKLIQGKRADESGIHNFGNIEFKAGVSEYNGRNMVWDPFYNCPNDCGGWNTVSTTWALVPYVKLRFKPGYKPSQGGGNNAVYYFCYGDTYDRQYRRNAQMCTGCIEKANSLAEAKRRCGQRGWPYIKHARNLNDLSPINKEHNFSYDCWSFRSWDHGCQIHNQYRYNSNFPP